MEVLENLRFKSIPRFQTKKYPAGTHKVMKNRLYAGFIFCYEGCMIIHYNGRDIIADEHHVVLAPQGIDYTFDVERSTFSPLIDFELYSGFFDDIYSIEVSECMTFYKNFLRMEKRYLYNLDSSELMGLSELYDIVARLNGYGAVSEKENIIYDSEIYLRENVYKEINMAEVAKKSNISEVYFRKLFKEKYHMTPYEYIEETRMSKAKELLLNSQLSISQISEECGYSSIYSFSRSFKNSVGTSPVKFKKLYMVDKK